MGTLKRYKSLSELPTGSTVIERGSFLMCEINTLTIPDGIETIQSDAFRECESLVSVYIPDSVTRIWIRAFYGCTSLQSVHIGKGIKEIDCRVFATCPNVTEFHIKSLVPPIVRGHYVLPFHKLNNPYNCTLYVPKGSLDIYRDKDGWKEFVNIVEE